MKKTKKVLLSMMALFGMIFMTNGVKAAELESQFIENLTAKKETDQIVVQFTLKKDIDLSTNRNGLSIWMYELDENGGHHSYGGMCPEEGCSKQVTKIIKNSDGTVADMVVDGQKLKKGMTIASYIPTQFYPEDANYTIDFYFMDNDYNFSSISYLILENKVISIDEGIDVYSKLLDTLTAEYGGEFAGPLGDETVMYIHQYITLTDDTRVRRVVAFYGHEGKTYEQLLAEAREQLDAAENKVVTTISDSLSTLSSDTLSAIQSKGYQATFEYTVYNEEADQEYVEYAWTFDGSQMTSSDYAVDLQLTVGNSKNKETIESLLENKEKSLVLEFAHHGELPKGTSVKVYVGNKYKDGDYVTLYYYNEETKALEEAVANIEVKDGYVEFGLEHCSEYVLNISTKPEEIVEPEVPTNSQQATQENKAPNNAQTSSMNVVFYSGLSVISLLGIAYLLVNKKKQA